MHPLPQFLGHSWSFKIHPQQNRHVVVSSGRCSLKLSCSSVNTSATRTTAIQKSSKCPCWFTMLPVPRRFGSLENWEIEQKKRNKTVNTLPFDAWAGGGGGDRCVKEFTRIKICTGVHTRNTKKFRLFLRLLKSKNLNKC